VKAIVVETAWLPEPAVTSVNVLSAGSSIGRRARTMRRGIAPSSTRRRSTMYWYSTESVGGR
jgi:hypothetical protein